MRSPVSPALPLASVFAFAALPGCSDGKVASLNARLARLSEKSQRIRPPCDAIRREASSLAAHFVTPAEADGFPYPKDRDTTRQLLQLAREFPEPVMNPGEFQRLDGDIAVSGADFDLQPLLTFYGCAESAVASPNRRSAALLPGLKDLEK